jgi:hypothetical protein
VAAALTLGAVPASAETVWLCKPGLADNPCEIPTDTTVREPSGAERVERPPVPADRPVDCFYVYPTVSNQLTPNANLDRDPEIDSIARYQAARFSLRCRVFAPIYRQGTLAGLATAEAQDTRTIRRIAYADVLAAWREYLARENRGRGVVLIGHSQGTRMLRQLLRAEIEPDAAQRARLVSALLLGGNVTVRRGSVRGGDFARTPLCTEPGESGCVVAYSSFAEDPPSNSRYGRLDDDADGSFGFPEGPEYEVACTDPVALAGRRGPLRLLVPTEPYAPGPIAAGIVVTNGGPPPNAPTTWVVPRDRATAGCRTINGAQVLRLEPTGDSRRPNPFPDPTWGTHLIDVNLALDDLVEIVGRQTETYLEQPPRLRLTRRCVGAGRLRVALSGDVGAVRDVNFKYARRLVARDAAGPEFRAVVPRSAMRRARRGTTLRAVVYLRSGEAGRVILERALPRCGVR